MQSLALIDPFLLYHQFHVQCNKLLFTILERNNEDGDDTYHKKFLLVTSAVVFAINLSNKSS